MIYDITHALFKLAPGAKWIYRGEGTDFTGIEWTDEKVTRPTDEELQTVVNAMNAAEPMRLLRLERDKRLVASDWMALPDRTITDQQRNYRQALRDITDGANPILKENGDLNMSSINWPTLE